MTDGVSSQLRNTVVYLATIVGTQLASFALLPLVTRFLGPASYGEYALALAISGLVGTIASSWIRNVAFRYYFEAREAGTTRSFYWSLACMQAVAVLAAFGIAVVVLPYLGQEVVPTPTLWAAAAMVAAADFQALTLAFVRAEQKSGRYAAAEVAAAVTRLVGTTAGLFAGLDDPAFLLLAAAGASVLGGAVSYFGLADRLTGPAALALRPMISVSRHVFGAVPFSIGEWIGNLSDRLVLNAYATTAVVGIYSAGFSLGDRIIGGLVMAVFMMAWPDILSAFGGGGYAAARVAVRRYFQIYLWLTVGPLVALIVFGDAVVGLLGAAYAGALQVVGLVAVAAWLRGLSSGFNRHFELEKRYYLLSAITIGGSLANLALNLWLVPRYLAVGAGISALAAQALVAVVYVATRDKRLVWFPASDLLLVVAACAAAGALSMLLLGNSVAGLVVFALGYAAMTLAVWIGRIRGLRSADAA